MKLSRRNFQLTSLVSVHVCVWTVTFQQNDLTEIVDVMVHLGLSYVKFVGQGHGSKFKDREEKVLFFG